MHQKDLTKGNVFSTMCLFAMPMILGNLLQQGYNIVDTWVVGHYIGSDALAAVGSAFTLMTFLTSILLGLCMGSGVVFSICFGAQDKKRLERGICSAFLLTSVVALVLMFASLILIDGIMLWLNIPVEIVERTRSYLFIVFCGIPAIALYNFFSAYLKALGNSIVPLVFLGVATGINIILDLVLVVVYPLGVAGTAWATIIAQYISGIGIGMYTLIHDHKMRQAFCRFNVKKESLKEIANYSLLTCMQQSVMNLGILMVQGLVNSFGTAIMAAFAASVKIEAFAYMPVQEYGNAFSTFIAQNMGAHQTKRVQQGFRYGVLTSIGYCFAISLVLWFLAKPLILIFIDPQETLIVAQGIRYLHTVGPFYFGIGCLFLLYGLYRAIGKPGVSVVLTIISLGTRVLLSYFLSSISQIGVLGIWWSIPIGWVLADLVGFLYYRKNKRKLLKE
ncbi:MATE family efflux transporter [Allobaculum stercoricanis]|uniref:MATE family efflux transporter n=1 Tax=Allobaculum stercoricanis TaxID=174709 RepID=UPI002942D791|nr:MATE family efflux transporter [Allobaculum stercoricanis]